MHLKFNNVNDAFYNIVAKIHRDKMATVCTTSRNGNVLSIPEPLTITFEEPRKRVLFNSLRDANPFFHLFESLWMLAGRNDLQPLEWYVSTMGNFSDDGQTFNGAYGYRWRNANDWYWKGSPDDNLDQLTILIEHLHNVPDSRRAVLQMWNVEDDLLKIGGPCSKCGGEGKYLVVYPHTPLPQSAETATPEICSDCKGTGKDPAGSKDVCCNLSVCFSLRPGGYCVRNHRDRSDQDKCHQLGHDMATCLDMTVFNRSNDLIWGTLGANVVHFSMLQEYVANCLGVQVGVYHQVSNNAHVYLNNWKPDEWLKVPASPVDYKGITMGPPLVKDQATFDSEVVDLVERCYGPDLDRYPAEGAYSEPFLDKVARPMFVAYAVRKMWHDDVSALRHIDTIQAGDWCMAARLWVERRMKKAGEEPYRATAKREIDRQTLEGKSSQ